MLEILTMMKNDKLAYENIIPALIIAVPEMKNYNEINLFLDNEDEDSPYSYYAIFSRILLKLLKAEKQDYELLDKCFIFMETMASCKDADVQTLLQVEVLEVLFELPFEIYAQVERSMMYLNTKKLHEYNKPYFRIPEPNKGTKLGYYRSRKDKKMARKYCKNKYRKT